MHRQEDRKILKNLYFEMEKLKIPRNIDNQQLLNWTEHLIDLDPYYAGLALSVAEGDKVTLGELYDIESLRKSLNSIQINEEQDKEVFEICNYYLKIIEKIDGLLRKFAKEKA
jgi:hypothetical protein